MSAQELTLLQKLKSSNASERKNALETLIVEELDTDYIEVVSHLFSDPDKGVRDAASMLFSMKQNPEIPKYIVRYIFSEDISIRNMAGEVLLKMREKSIPALMNEMGQGNSDDEKFIIDLLGWIGNPEPTSKIIEVLTTNTDENVILACAEALGNIKSEEAVPHLLALVENDPDEIWTPTVMEALGKIGNKETIDHFLKVYNEQDILTKYTIIESLGRVGDVESLQFLLEELSKTESVLVGSIVKSSENLLSKLGLEIEFNDELKSIILQAFDESDDEIVYSAVKLLIGYEDKNIIKGFVSIYGKSDEFDEIFRDKFFANPKTSTSLIRQRINKNGENKKDLLILYKDMMLLSDQLGLDKPSDDNQLEFLNTLSTLIDNADEEIRMVAAELLFQINARDALLFVDKLIYDDNVWNRLKLIDLLSDVQEPEALEIIKKLTKDSDDMVRERAESILDEKQTRI